jgi:Ni,Fe-hydrogenase III small subunit/Pyruvate/2-oxoacid:ferredoxin oxidoreductase delta subunit
MLHIIAERLKQKSRTIGYPKQDIVLPKRYRGLPVIDREICSNCVNRACISYCPTEALSHDKKLAVDIGRCIFCTECSSRCKNKAVKFTADFRLSVRERRDLVLTCDEFTPAKKLEEKMIKLFGRSLKLRQVSAGGCNACEADINVLSTVTWDIGRFGIQVVASPRHADGLLVTGPVTKNMRIALQKTYAAVPHPKIVVAVGACAISGGIYRKSPDQQSGVGSILPVDLFIPGCPPHPATILDGLLRLIGRI